MNLRKAIKRWVAAGGTVEPVRRTGEIRCSHAALTIRIVVNSRRKDASRALLVALKRIEVPA